MRDGQEKVSVCVSHGESALRVMTQLNRYTDLMSEHSAQIATAVEQVSYYYCRQQPKYRKSSI